MTEEWKAIPGFKGMYEISNLGHVRSLDRQWLHRNRTVVIWKGREIKVRHHYHGYTRFDMHKKGKRYTMFTHVAVALAFLPNRKKRPFVNHIDGDKANNMLENLEWSTEAENSQHYQKKLKNKGNF